MAEETTPAAAVETPATEASQPTNTQTEAPAEQPAEAPKTPTYEITDDQRKFIESNGGWEKVFEKAKKAISQPEPAPEKPETPAQPEQRPVEPAQQPQKQQGYLSPSDIAALQYRQMLANEEQYKDIRDYITGKGESKTNFLEEMKLFGMNPVDANGNLNDVQIRRFLDLKAAAVPAKQTSAPVTTTPTVEYVNVGDTITKIEDAYAILQQNMALKAAGRAEHPKTADANKFIKDHFAARKAGGRK